MFEFVILALRDFDLQRVAIVVNDETRLELDKMKKTRNRSNFCTQRKTIRIIFGSKCLYSSSFS